MVCLISAASALDINVGGIGVHVGGTGGNGNSGGRGRQSSPGSRTPTTTTTTQATAALGLDVDLNVLLRKKVRAGINARAEQDPGERKRETPKDILDLGESSVHLLVGNLSDEDQFALKKKCSDVLANPSWFDPSLVALCQIIVR